MKILLQKKKLHCPYQDVEHAVPPDFAPRRTLKDRNLKQRYAFLRDPSLTLEDDTQRDCEKNGQRPLTVPTVADYTAIRPHPQSLAATSTVINTDSHQPSAL